MKILLCENINIKAIDILKSNLGENIEIDHINYAPTEDEFCKIIGQYDLLGIRSRSKINKNILDNAHKLKAIGCFSIGTNQVDLDYSLEKGIIVFNAPFSNTRSVAELTMATIVMLFRNIMQRNLEMHAKKWQKSAENSFEIRKKKLGIIGYGNIGSQLSVLASAFGMHVYFYDKNKKLAHGNAHQLDSLEELLKISDVVTLHVPSTSETKNMIGEREFNHMKKGSYIINHARGDLIDEDALCKAIDEKIIFGAALDVYQSEPANNNTPFENKLSHYENILLTPHIGGSTKEAQEKIAVEVCEKLSDYTNIGTSYGSVNFPQISLSPVNKGHRRIISIHKNIPGVLGKVNSLFSDLNINIESQHLATKNNVGILAIDISAEKSDVINEIKKFPWNISLFLV